jgi:integrase
MGRPPLPVGTFGKVAFIQRPNGDVQARTLIRDYDGRRRMVSKIAKSRAAAERALKAELLRRQAPVGKGAVTSATTVSELADAWLDGDHNWSTGTERAYRSVVKVHVKPAVGGLRVREVTPGVISRALSAIAVHSGAGAAKTARSCLSGMFRLAVRDDAAVGHPVREAAVRIKTSKRSPRALTVEETDRLTTWLRGNDHARSLDLPDLVDWLLATGCRIGEALALRYATNDEGNPLLDLDARTWEVNATVVRVRGVGLVIQPRPKTAAGWRVVALPSFAVQMLEERPARSRRRTKVDRIVFTSPLTSTLRDPTNVGADLRHLLDGFECDHCKGTGYRLDSSGKFELALGGQRLRCDEGPWSWVTSHTFRKTVATRLDEAGFTPRQVADQLGHANPSLTLDVYFGRHVVSTAAAEVLDRPAAS